MFSFFTRDTADRREIKRLEGLIETLTTEKAEAFELIRKYDAELHKLRVESKRCLTAHASLLHTAEAMERDNIAMQRELACSFIRNERGQIRHHPSYFAGREIAA